MDFLATALAGYHLPTPLFHDSYPWFHAAVVNNLADDDDVLVKRTFVDRW